jgi:hypothetical protein
MSHYIKTRHNCVLSFIVIVQFDALQITLFKGRR